MTIRRFLVEVQSNDVDQAHTTITESVYSSKVLEVDNFDDFSGDFFGDGRWSEGKSIGESFESAVLTVIFEK